MDPNGIKGIKLSKLPMGLRLAKLGASKSTYKVKVGACLITRGGNIVISWNRKRSSPAAIRYGYPYSEMSHAEFNLFSHTDIDERYNGTVFVYREMADKTTALAKPCNYCMLYLKLRGIKNIMFTSTKYPGYIKEKL